MTLFKKNLSLSLNNRDFQGMFIEYSRYDLSNEVPLGIHDLLQAGPHPVAGFDHGLPVGVGEHLHD